MGVPQTPSPTHLYPQALQLKLYQAFIFSVPILFSIILFLLFYLFYLKRRRDSTHHSSSQPLPRRLNQPTSLDPLAFEVDSKEDLRENLPVIMFDEDLRRKDSQCCVCLGDYELDEQLHQIPSCKHLFHIDCIHHWLQANLTCPLCRCHILPSKKLKSEPSGQVEELQRSEEHSTEVSNVEESSDHLNDQRDSSLRDSVVIQIETHTS